MAEPVDLDVLVRELEALEEEPLVAAEYIEFRSGLLQVQAAILSSLEPPAEMGAFPLGVDDLAVDPGVALEVARWFRHLSPGEDEGDYPNLHKWGEENPENLVDLARRAAFTPEDDWFTTTGFTLRVNKPALYLLGRATAAPYIHHRVQCLRQAGTEPRVDPERGACPACGSGGALALLEGEAEWRRLCCPLCGESWRHTRSGCPTCGATGPGSQVRLGVMEGDPAWVEGCEACRHYTKIVDLAASGGSAIALVREMATLHLDLLAEGSRYRPRPPYVSLI